MGVGHLTFDGVLDDFGFFVTPGEKEDLACLANGAHAHGDGAYWNVLLCTEYFKSLDAAGGVKEHETCVTVALRTCDVEGDITHATDAEECDIDTSHLLNHFLVGDAMLVDTFLRGGAVKRIDVLRGNVNAVEELLAQDLEVGLYAV